MKVPEAFFVMPAAMTRFKFQQIQIFLKVAEAGSVTAAAHELSLTQPAVTKSLRQLEENCCTRLFLRTTEGLVLSPAGVRLLPYARRVTAELELAGKAMEDVVAGRAGTLRMAVAPTLPPAVVAKAVRDFRQKFPDTALEFTGGLLNEAVPLVQAGKLDLALILASDSAQRALTNLSCDPLYEADFGFVAHAGHPAASATTASELADYEWLVTKKNRTLVEENLAQAAAICGLDRAKSVTYCDVHVFESLLLESDALGFAPICVACSPLHSGWLSPVSASVFHLAPLTGAFFGRREAELLPQAVFMKDGIRTHLKAYLAAHPDEGLRIL